MGRRAIDRYLAVADHVDEAALADVAPADERSFRQHRLLRKGRHANRALVGPRRDVRQTER